MALLLALRGTGNQVQSQVRMIGLQHTFLDGERLLIQRLSLGKFSLLLVEHSQVVESGSCIGMIGSHSMLVNGQRTLIENFGLLIFPQIRVERGQIIERLSNRFMNWSIKIGRAHV